MGFKEKQLALFSQRSYEKGIAAMQQVDSLSEFSDIDFLVASKSQQLQGTIILAIESFLTSLNHANNLYQSANASVLEKEIALNRIQGIFEHFPDTKKYGLSGMFLQACQNKLSVDLLIQLCEIAPEIVNNVYNFTPVLDIRQINNVEKAEKLANLIQDPDFSLGILASNPNLNNQIKSGLKSAFETESSLEQKLQCWLFVGFMSRELWNGDSTVEHCVIDFFADEKHGASRSSNKEINWLINNSKRVESILDKNSALLWVIKQQPFWKELNDEVRTVYLGKPVRVQGLLALRCANTYEGESAFKSFGSQEERLTRITVDPGSDTTLPLYDYRKQLKN